MKTNNHPLISKIARQRKIVAAIVIFGLLALGVVKYRSVIYALTKTFIQTDWSGGADEVSTANDSNLTGWSKYYSKSSSIDTETAGEAKLKLEVVDNE